MNIPKTSTELEFEEYCILVIDDNPANLSVVAEYLEDVGFDIMVAGDGELGLQRARQVQPNLILLDVMMPGIDGFETCRRLKAEEATKDIPVIFMTSRSETEDKVTGFNVGAVDYVTKPLQQDEVLTRVITHLRIRDLTQKLQRSNEELTRINAHKDKLFSIIAHDLIGPFQPIMGMSYLLTETVDTATPEEVKEMSSAIYVSASNTYNLLENLLHWSRLQQGRIEAEPSRFDLKQIAEKNIDLFAESAARKRVSLRNKVGEETFVYADKNMMDMVIRNLVSNALKFTPHGGQVTISASPSNSAAKLTEVSVADTGVGISEENLQKLFKVEHHYTTMGTDKEKGTGLGLIVCKEMVEMNGGQIWLESELGQGTTVKFTVSKN